jgi:hypothetical protein
MSFAASRGCILDRELAHRGGARGPPGGRPPPRRHLAFFVAEQGDGLVWFYHRDWASPADRGTNIFTTA